MGLVPYWKSLIPWYFYSILFSIFSIRKGVYIKSKFIKVIYVGLLSVYSLFEEIKQSTVLKNLGKPGSFSEVPGNFGILNLLPIFLYVFMLTLVLFISCYPC